MGASNESAASAEKVGNPLIPTPPTPPKKKPKKMGTINTLHTHTHIYGEEEGGGEETRKVPN